MDHSELIDQVSGTLDKLSEIGFDIRMLSSDLGNNFRSMIDQYGVTVNNPYVTHQEKKVWVFTDMPYVMKCAMNCLYSHKKWGTRMGSAPQDGTCWRTSTRGTGSRKFVLPPSSKRHISTWRFLVQDWRWSGSCNFSVILLLLVSKPTRALGSWERTQDQQPSSLKQWTIVWCLQFKCQGWEDNFYIRLCPDCTPRRVPWVDSGLESEEWEGFKTLPITLTSWTAYGPVL